ISPVLRLLNQPEGIIPFAHEYLVWISPGLPAFLAFFCMRQLVEATSNPRMTLRIVVFGAILNIPLDYLFIFGWGPIPPMGVKGAALATATVQWSMFLGLLWQVICTRKFHELHL